MIYLLFALVTFVLIVIDNWMDGEDLRWVNVFAFVVMSMFPIMNVLCFVVALCKIVSKLTPDVLLKGRK